MTFIVAVTDSVFPSLESERRILDSLGVELRPGQCRSEEDIVALAEKADAVLNCYAPKLRPPDADNVGVPGVACHSASGFGAAQWVRRSGRETTRRCPGLAGHPCVPALAHGSIPNLRQVAAKLLELRVWWRGPRSARATRS